MNQSRDPLGSPASRCTFYSVRIAAAVVLIVSAFLIKQDSLLASAGFTTWSWLLLLPVLLIPTRRRHGRMCACSPYDCVEESDPTHG